MSFRYHRRMVLDNGDTGRVEEDGTVTRGREFIGEDGLVHWLSDEHIQRLGGVGEYSGDTGFGVLGERSARLA